VKKIILNNFLSPSADIMLTAAVRDLHLGFPGEYATGVRTECLEYWENNPYLASIALNDPDVEIIDCEYPLINYSNKVPYHFIHGFRLFLSEKLGVNIPASAFKGEIYLSENEKMWLSQVDEITGYRNTSFWIIVTGGKKNFTAKLWDPTRYQEVVDHFRDRVLFVQCGSSNDLHSPLNSVIDLVGQTDLRQLARLMYHADGVICPVGMFMHLAAAVEVKDGRPRNRPCVVVAGGREPSQWEAYPHHQYLHRNGCLPCCDDGGCWKSRVVPIGDGTEYDHSLCLYPIRTSEDSLLPKCMDLVSSQDVINAVENYLKYESYAWRAIYGAGNMLPVTTSK